MKKLFISQFAIGVISVLVWSILGTVPASQAAGPVNFHATDEPGPWFKCVGNGCVPKSLALTESLAIVPPNTEVRITVGGQTNTVHTFTSLLYPTGATNMPFDQPEAFRGSRSVRLVDPGLYVFVCKLHPFMLAATIVDDPATVALPPLPAGPAYDLGENVTLISYGGLSIPTTSDLAARLVRAFFLITNPANYQDHTTGLWNVTLPGVVVQRTGGNQVSLGALNIVNAALPSLSPPIIEGVGEVWIDTQFEKTAGKTKPGTATAVDTSTWKVTKKVALPGINMNNPHNMWTDRNQTVIYQTQWFDHKLAVFNRETGALVRNIHVGDAPAHVMTRVDNDYVHVSLNGEDAVVELKPGKMHFSRRIFTQFPGDLAAQPHAHWMSHDGNIMVTPNSNTGDSTRIDIPSGGIIDKVDTGTLPIATGMMPDASKYYVSNYLDSTITCISIIPGACKGADIDGKKTINLLLGGTTLANYDHIDGSPDMSASGALPIQTPVSPDGLWVVTANTLSGTISFISTVTDTLEKVIACSAGCHGVNFGAKKGGGYYAYVSSKFSNDLIIVDLATQAEVGRILLVADLSTAKDDTPTLYQGMGGQGVLPIPLVYNGWVQKLPTNFFNALTLDQKCPLGHSSPSPCPTLVP
jgi:DNA-binding beta-propeller fold protein YncE